MILDLLVGFGAAAAAIGMLLLGAHVHEAVEAAKCWLLIRLMPAQGSHSAAVLAADLPRRKPLVNRQPWQTSEFPAVAVPEAQRALDPGDGLDEPALTRPYLTDEQTRDLYFTRGLSPDCANGCHAPLCGGRNCSCDYHGKAAPVYWEASQDTVDEAQRAAERVIA